MLDPRKLKEGNISNLRFSNNYYEYGSEILQNNEIKEYLKSGSHEELRKVTKISKEIEMVCVEEKE